MSLIFLNLIRGVAVDEDENESEIMVPVIIRAECVRSFNPRRDGKPGTRITFSDGGGFAVSEEFNEIRLLLQPDTTRQLPAN